MDPIIEKRLSEANDLREAEKYGESAKVYTDCLIELLKSGDPIGLIHCLGGQSLIYKNLLTVTDKPTYRHLTLHFAKEGLEIGEQNKDKIDGRTLSISYRCYGDALIVNQDLATALVYFEKALAVTTAGVPEKGHLQAHIGGLKYLTGNKDEGKELIYQSLADIRSGDLSDFTIRVWETGVLNNLAKIFSLEGKKTEALALANESLQIATDHQLPIRKREVEEILVKINSGETNFSI